MQYFFCTTEQKGTVFYNTSSTNSSEHQSCGWDIWSDIPERFQHLSKTIRHRGGALVTASAAKRCDRFFFFLMIVRVPFAVVANQLSRGADSLQKRLQSACERHSGFLFLLFFPERMLWVLPRLSSHTLLPYSGGAVVASSILRDPYCFAWDPQKEWAAWRAALSNYTTGEITQMTSF